MGQYYYLIAGLPELQLDDQKLKLTLSEFKSELREHLSEADLKVISYFFMQFDNINLLRFLENPEAELDTLANLSNDDWKEILLLFNETDEPVYAGLPNYFKKFIPAYRQEKPLYVNMSWEDQITSLFFDYAVSCKNEFISQWYSYNLNITNILTAVNCLKHGFDRESAIVGNGEVAEALRYSNSRDFGIIPVFPEVEEVLRLVEEPDLYERERKIDLMKWNWLEEKGFFHYFDIEHLFIYLIRLQMLARWVKLEKKTGLIVFREMIGQLQTSFEFPNEFTIKKVK